MSDPYLPAAQAAVEAFRGKTMTDEAALAVIWSSMRAASTAGWPVYVYVKLSDDITFGDEQPPDKDGSQGLEFRWIRVKPLRFRCRGLAKALKYNDFNSCISLQGIAGPGVWTSNPLSFSKRHKLLRNKMAIYCSRCFCLPHC